MTIVKQKALLDAFKQFADYHFVLKFESKLINLQLPENVIVRPWLPQADILAHPKLKAFITHAGDLPYLEILMTQESVALYDISFWNINSNKSASFLHFDRIVGYIRSTVAWYSNGWHSIRI